MRYSPTSRAFGSSRSRPSLMRRSSASMIVDLVSPVRSMASAAVNSWASQA